MPAEFEEAGYQWTIREGGPSMGSVEATSPTFVEALRAADSHMKGLTLHELSSWVIARLSYLTCGMIDQKTFSHDTNEFGYAVRITDSSGERVAHGAVVIGESRLVYSASDFRTSDSQALFVQMLASSPRDLAICEVKVREPETRRCRSYGWNGRLLIS